MTRSDFSEHWHDLLAGHALDALSPAEQAELDRLLQDHPELEAEKAVYDQTLAQLPHALVPVAPPAGLEARILAAAQGSDRAIEAHSRDRSPGRSPRVIPWRGGWGVGTAIAAGLILVMGWDNLRLRRAIVVRQQDLDAATALIQQLQQQQRQTETILTQLRTGETLYLLEGVGSLAGASGSLLTLPGQDEAILIASDVPALPSDQVYRLWALDKEAAAPVFCGAFNRSSPEAVQWSLPTEVCGAAPDQMLVTIDPVNAPPVPTGELVLQSVVR